MKNYQRGFTLIEILGALAISAVLLVGLTSIVDSSLEDTKGQQAALYQALVVNAATQYIQTNYSTLLDSASPTTPVVVTRADLTPPTGTPYLSPNVAATNIYGQTPCILVLKPTSGKLDALVVTYGNQLIPDIDLPGVAANSGQGGGYISSAKPTAAQGTTWALDSTKLANFKSAPCLTGTPADGGHLASAIFFDGPGQLSTDFLYRDLITGRPELNTMNTPILLANGAVVSEGDACGATAGIAVDASRNLLSCDITGKWAPISTWKAPVATYAELPLTDQPGDVRMVTGLNRAFTNAGGTWVALAVDQNDNLTVPGSISAGHNITAVQDVTGSHDIYAGNDAHIGHDATVGNDITAQDNVTANSGVIAKVWTYSPSYEIGTMFPVGAKCNYWTGAYAPDGSPIIAYPTGSIVSDPAGVTMSCYSDNTFRYENGTDAPGG